MLHMLNDMVHAGCWLNFWVKGKNWLDKGRTRHIIEQAAKNMKHQPKIWQW